MWFKSRRNEDPIRNFAPRVDGKSQTEDGQAVGGKDQSEVSTVHTMSTKVV